MARARHRYHQQKRGAPGFGFIVLLIVAACGWYWGSQELADGATRCGTALAPLGVESDDADFEYVPGQTTPQNVGKTGCDRVVTDRRMALIAGCALGVAVAGGLAIGGGGGGLMGGGADYGYDGGGGDGGD